MSYGFQVLNSAGEVVIDDTSPVYHLGATATLSPTGTAGSYNTFDISSYVGGTNLVFFNLPVGALVSRLGSTLFSGLSSLSIRQAVLASSLTPLTSGFGMQVFDASGNLTFQAADDLIPITAGYSLPTSSAGVGTQGEAWFSIPTPAFYFDGSVNPGYRLAEGISRTATSSIQFVGTVIGPGIGATTSAYDLLVIGAN